MQETPQQYTQRISGYVVGKEPLSNRRSIARLGEIVAASVARGKAVSLITNGLNAALLPVDLARLTFDQLSDDSQWLRQPRFKTGIDRMAWLWPETVEALTAGESPA